MSGSKEDCISVSGYKLVNCDKPYYTYTIHVRMFQQHYIVEKRYSELHKCHSELKTKFPTPSFPPKKIRSNHQKVLTERRFLLELYLKEMFKFGPSRNQVLAFLGVNSKNSQPQASTSRANEKRAPTDSSTPKRIEHQPVFIVNPNIDRISKASGEHDLIVNGALKALYG